MRYIDAKLGLLPCASLRSYFILQQKVELKMIKKRTALQRRYNVKRRALMRTSLN